MVHISMYMNDISSAQSTGLIIASYLKKTRCNAVLRIKSSINDMVALIDENDTDIFIVDFSTPEVGLELCKLIRDKNILPSIFIVNIDPLLINTKIFFRPSAILENVAQTKEFITILNRLRQEKQFENRYFSFKCDGEIIRVPFESIEYFESNAKVVTLFLEKSSKKYCFNSKLSDIESILPEYFLRCHQSYIVNMNHIARLDGINHSFFLFSKDEVLISRRMYAEAFEKYKAFMEIKSNM